MRHSFVIALALLALPLAGCGGDSGAAGTWRLDAEATISALSSDAADAIPEPMLEGLKASEVEIELRADGTFHVKSNMRGETDTASGTWSQSGNVVSLSETEHNGKKREGADSYQGTLDGGTLVLKPEAGMRFSLVLVKQ